MDGRPRNCGGAPASGLRVTCCEIFGHSFRMPLVEVDGVTVLIAVTCSNVEVLVPRGPANSSRSSLHPLIVSRAMVA